MIASWVESIVVGCVGQSDHLAIGGSVAVRAAGTINIASFLGLDAIACFVWIRIVAHRIGGIIPFAQNLSILVDVVGLGADQQSGDKAERLQN